MVDDGWWSDVTHRDGEVTVGVHPDTPRIDLTASEDPVTERLDLTTGALTSPAVEAPAPPAANDDEVPFWLLPAPPRPGLSAPPPAPGSGLTAQYSPTAQYQAARPRASTPLPSRRSVARGPARGTPAARGRELLEQATAAAGPLLARLREVPPVFLAAAAVFGVGVVVVLVSILSLGGDEPAEGTTSDSTARPPAATVTPVPVDRATVTATASSEQTAEGSTTYSAANTIDGVPTTAWNSDGGGRGITLTYTFDTAIDLRSVSIANGYQKVVRSKGENLDLYTANSRVKEVRIVTDGGTSSWTLKDARAAQPLRKNFGPTKTLTVEIVSVYKGAKFNDIAISEVAFTAAG